ncbi:MAG: MMPL family transporter [Nitrospirales bacterium]
MISTRALSWFFWFVAIGLGVGFAATTIPVHTELPLLLPSSGSFSQQLFVDQLQSGPTSRILLLGLQGAEPAVLAKASKKLADAMRKHGQFLHVYNGEQTQNDFNQDLLYRYRYLLSSTVTADQFSPERLRQSLEHRLQDMANPLPAFFKKQVPEDPTGALASVLQQWRSGNTIKMAHGVWFSSDQLVALLIAETAVAGFDLDGQEAIQSFLTSSLEDIRATASPQSVSTSLELLRSGPSVFAVQSRAVIQQDAQWLSLLGSGFVIMLLLVTYRSFTILFLGLVPLVTGLLTAGITVYMVFGFIHGMTLAFGATLIGVAIDYPLHAFAHLGSAWSPRQAILKVWPTILLGATTTAVGYGAMLFSGFPGLSQLALLAMTGLLTAAATTRWILPLLIPPQLGQPISWAAWIPFEGMASRLILIVPLSMVLSLGYLAVSEKPFWETDIANLSPIPQNLRDRDVWLRKELGAPAARDMIIIVAPDEQHVLEQSEALKVTLDQLVDRGYMTGYEMAANYLPSIQTQMLRQRALPEPATLRNSLKEAQQGLPFKPSLFEPFLQSMRNSQHLTPLDYRTFQDTPFATKIRSLLYPYHDQWVGTILIHEVQDRSAIEDAIHTDTSSGLHFLNLKTESNRMVTTYRQEVTTYLAIGVGFLVLILGLGLRSFKKVATVLIPIAGSIMLDLGLLHAFGERLSLFHLAALLLVFGIGLDYTLFFQRPFTTVTERQQTISAIMVCSLTTITVFGLLACSQTPVLHGIGLTVFFGSLICFLFAAICFPIQRQQTT